MRRKLSRYFSGGRWLAYVFLLCVLPTGLGLIYTTPMCEVPDEPGHVVRADGLLHGQILGVTPPGKTTKGQVLIDRGALQACLDELWPSFPDHPLPVAARQKAQGEHWGQLTYWPTNMVQYFPALYLPGALGIGLGHLAGTGPLKALYLGRVGMLASFLLMGFIALQLAAFGRPILFVLLTLPMTLELAASLNQDGQLIAATALSAALLTGGERKRDWGLALFSLVLCAKPPYIPLLLAWLLPFRGPGLWRRAQKVALAAIPPVLWLALMVKFSFAPWPRPHYHPGPLWPGSHSIWMTKTSLADNLTCLLAHPWQIILLPLNTLQVFWPNLKPAIIGVFGWGPVQMQPWAYPAWTITMTTAFVGVLLTPRNEWHQEAAAFIVILLLLTFLLMSLSLYLSWTNVGETLIAGINGRYYLLFVPFAVLALPGLGRHLPPRWSIRLAALCCLPAIIMAAVDIVALPKLLLHAYGSTGF